MRLRLSAVVCAMCAVATASTAQTPARGLRDAVERRVADTDQGEEGQIQSKIDSLSLMDKISQLMLVTLEGESAANNSDRRLLKVLPLGGVVLPRPRNPLVAIEYVRWLRSLPTEKVRELPFIIATNAYSLTHSRLRPGEGYLSLPSRMAIGAADNAEATRALMTQVGRILYDTGFNLHLGPSLEFNSTLENARASLLAFGGQPDIVARIGMAFLGAFTDAGLATVPMGFPGGGANRKERDPAVLLTPKHALIKSELIPYAQAIELGVPMIHVGTTLVPTLEKGATPACLSSAVIQGLLRLDLGFDGLILAGPIDTPEVMHGIGASEAAIAALRAGADMLYWRRPGSRMLRVVSEIATAVEQGILSESLISHRAGRVLKFKSDEGLLERELPQEKNIRDAPKHLENMRKLERQSVTLIKNVGNLLPLTKKESLPLGVTGVIGVEELHDALEAYIKPIVQQRITTAKYLGSIQDFEITRLVRRSKGLSVVVAIFSGIDRPQGAARLIRKIQLAGTKVVIVILGYPKHLEALQGADAILLTFGTLANVKQSMSAVADILAGNAPLSVLPAIRELQRRPTQAVTFNAYDVMRSPTGRMPISLNPPFVAGYSVQYDPVLSFNKVQWDFGDGTKSRAIETAHAYALPGRYTVKLSLTSKDGVTTSGNFHINVEE